MDVAPFHRPMCLACGRPQSACACAWVTQTANTVDVLILQHPLEVGQAKNTGGLLHLSLSQSRLWVGESFDPAELKAAMEDGGRQAVLLYPDVAPRVSQQAPARVADASSLGEPGRLRLVVLDATWRKSRKMLNLNPALQSLPRLALRDLPASGYTIRKAHQPDQLSTLEACCAALAQLEGDPGRYRPLTEAFRGFVEQQQALKREGAVARLAG
jgi:DTW domain-containing protein